MILLWKPWVSVRSKVCRSWSQHCTTEICPFGCYRWGLAPSELFNRNNMLGFLRRMDNGCRGKNTVPSVTKNLGGKKVASTGGG